MTLDDVKKTIGPLMLIFWGTLICLVDFYFTWTQNGEGFRFDVINDAVGTIMIAVGVFKLGAIEVHDRYARALAFVKTMAVVAIALAVVNHFIFRQPAALSVLFLVLGMLQLVAIVVFCVAMRWFCDEAQLERSSRSWRTTTILFVVIYLIPLGVFYLASLVAILTGTSFNIDLGPVGLLLLPIFFIPLVHFLVSSRRMMRDAEASRPGPGEDASAGTLGDLGPA